MRIKLLATALIVVLAAGSGLSGQQAQTPAQPTFRSTVNLVLVDVVVRDKKGAIVTGLTRDDFQLIEDGKPQQILTFAFEEIAKTTQPVENASLLAGAAPAGPSGARDGACRRARARHRTSAATPLTSEEVAESHRLLHAALRYQLDAARGRAESSRLRNQVGRREDDVRGSRRRRDDRIESADSRRLLERQGTGARHAAGILCGRRHGVRAGRRREHARPPTMRHRARRADSTTTDVPARRNSTRLTTTCVCALLATAGRGARADSAEEGDHLFQLGDAAQRHRQPGGAPRGGQRGRARERRDLSRRLTRPAGRRSRRQRASGQSRRPQRVHRFGSLATSSRSCRSTAGDVDDAGRRTRVARPFSIPTISARRSARLRKISRRTTSSATPVRTATRTDATGASASVCGTSPT